MTADQVALVKLTLNAQGPVSPLDKREDFLETVKAIKKLRQQEEQPSKPPILPSCAIKRMAGVLSTVSFFSQGVSLAIPL